jgi:membrane associated rhomboid family serine protease
MNAICFIGLFFISILLNTLFLPLPINDDEQRMRYGTFPWATVGLIVVNTVIFLVWLAPKWAEWGYDYSGYTAESLANAIHPYYETVWTYGYRASYLENGFSIGGFIAFTSIFMHADMAHLFGNMAYLWTFGHRLEDSCGSWRFLAFYLVCGMIASMGSAAVRPLIGPDVPGIGASGAISGILGAYMVLFFGTRIQTIYLFGSLVRIPTLPFRQDEKQIWKWVTTMRAFWLLFAYAILNTLFSFITLGLSETGGVDYFAHYFGFIAGLTIFFFLRKDMVVRYSTGRAL